MNNILKPNLKDKTIDNGFIQTKFKGKYLKLFKQISMTGGGK